LAIVIQRALIEIGGVVGLMKLAEILVELLQLDDAAVGVCRADPIK